MNDFMDWAGTGLVRLAAWIVQCLPISPALSLGEGLGRLFYFLNPRRRVAYANLKAAFPESSAAERRNWVRDFFVHLGLSAAEMLRVPVLDRAAVEKMVIEKGADRYLKLRREGKPVILLTAHFGNWELSQISEALKGRPLTVLARRQKYRRLNRLLNSYREAFGTVAVGKGGEIRDLIRALRQGGVVGMLGDQAGGNHSVWVRFFGRLTTAPRGPMALALKFNLSVLPVFLVRRGRFSHELVYGPESFELERTGDLEKDIQRNTQRYFEILESVIRENPSQWLWAHKRWKRRRTTRALILSDGKPGHVKQSETLLEELSAAGRQAEPPYEILPEIIPVEFRSPLRKFLFPFFSLFFIPWAQGRLHWLRFFFTPDCQKKMEKAAADLVVSAGGSLVPLNLCLVRENLAKSAVLMRPGFPFNLFRYDLAVIPSHDRGPLPGGALRVEGGWSRLSPERLESAGRKLAATLRDPGKIRWSLFLGGETRNFKLPSGEIEQLIHQLEAVSQKTGAGFLVTSSRRTPGPINRLLHQRLSAHPHCQLFVDPARDPRPEAAPGMMALAETLIVTEDSVSMISEALSTGKKVVIVKLGQNGLPRKHLRFQKNLAEAWGIPVVGSGRLQEILERDSPPGYRPFLEAERKRVREKLEGLLS